MNLETLATVILGVFIYDILIKPFIRTVYKSFSNLKYKTYIENPNHFWRGITVVTIFCVALGLFTAYLLIAPAL